MALDIHAFNFIRLQAAKSNLGKVLTVGRQSLSIDPGMIARLFPDRPQGDGYCEKVLEALGAERVESIDYSDYEGATHVADLGSPVDLEESYDTIIDAGSLEHIFDVGMAFKNVIRHCCIGGQIIHVLPVNNLNGHGFWQFSSDLMYSVFSDQNGFSDTEIYYASSIDPQFWYLMPRPGPGARTEIVSLEPIILLAVSRKVASVEPLSVTQPFYQTAWGVNPSAQQAEIRSPRAGSLRSLVKRILGKRGRLRTAVRNVHLVVGLIFGTSPYSLKCQRFKRIDVNKLLSDLD